MFRIRIAEPRPDLASSRGESWFSRAACRSVDRRLFFEAEGESVTKRTKRVRQAKAVCAVCPVRRECLAFALSTPERYGIWGGFTARERAGFRRRSRPRPAQRTDRRGP